MADEEMLSDDVPARREVAARMTEAAHAWLETLAADQRGIGRGAVPSDERDDNERRRWFYTPTDHGGLTIHQQRPAQQRAAMRLVGFGASAPGGGTGAPPRGRGVTRRPCGSWPSGCRHRGTSPSPRPWAWRTSSTTPKVSSRGSIGSAV